MFVVHECQTQVLTSNYYHVPAHEFCGGITIFELYTADTTPLPPPAASLQHTAAPEEGSGGGAHMRADGNVASEADIRAAVA